MRLYLSHFFFFLFFFLCFFFFFFCVLGPPERGFQGRGFWKPHRKRGFQPPPPVRRFVGGFRRRGHPPQGPLFSPPPRRPPPGRASRGVGLPPPPPSPPLPRKTFPERNGEILFFAQYVSFFMNFLRRLRPFAFPHGFWRVLFHEDYDGSGKRLVRSRTLPRICSRAAASSRRFRASLIRSAISSISSSFMPRVVTAGVPMRMPPGLKIG